MPNLTYGKIFQTMFTGSMCGAGAHVFAVMSYVVSYMQPDRDRVEHVRLPVVYLSKIIGEKEEVIQSAIDFLCKEDKASNSPEEGGRRLVPEGGFAYRVVNGQYYRELKDEEDRLRKDAARSARYRERHPERVKRKKRASGGPSVRERLAVEEYGATGEIRDSEAGYCKAADLDVPRGTSGEGAAV